PSAPISSARPTNPQIAIDTAGNIVVLWQESNGSNTVTMGAILPCGVSGGKPFTLTCAGQSAVDSKGNQVSVYPRSGPDRISRLQGWVQRSGSSDQIQTNELSHGGGDAINPQVVVDANG